MSDNEVNKIIAEFMGWKIVKYATHGLSWKIVKYAITGLMMIKEGEKSRYTDYTKSLDALVPVWGKLEDIPFMTISSGEYHAMMMQYKCFSIKNNYQQAAAHATAKAILELNKYE